MSSSSFLKDHFDRLPDAIVHVMFNKLQDAKSLCRCMCVCKRFGSIIPQIHTIAYTVPPQKSFAGIGNEPNDRNSKSSLPNNLFKSLIKKPVHLLRQTIKSKPSSSWSVPEYWQEEDWSDRLRIEVLKSFREIRTLYIELPHYADQIGACSSDALVKWKAEFGRKLESCVILAATSFYKSSSAHCNGEEEEEEVVEPDSSFTIEMNLRFFWTVSCVNAASARHRKLRQLICDHQRLQRVVITDARKQGRLCMRTEQIEELRNSMNSEDMKLSPTSLSKFETKLWYVPVLKLSASGWVMKGATLVVVRPVYGPTAVEIDGDWMTRAFDGEEDHKAFGEAMRMMMMKEEDKKTYSLNLF